VTGQVRDPALSYNQADTAIGAQAITGTFSLSGGNQIGIANLYSSTATGGVLAIGARAASAPTLLLAEANSGIGSRIATNAAQGGGAYGVLAYTAAGRLG
jgi:hypothetical protein